MPATPSYIPLPEGIPAPPVPPVLAATLPGVMTVPPPILGASNSPAAPNIDTSQPPPNMSPNSKAAGSLGVLSGPSLTLPQLGPRIPVMAKPGLMMPPFSFTSLPRKSPFLVWSLCLLILKALICFIIVYSALRNRRAKYDG